MTRHPRTTVNMKQPRVRLTRTENGWSRRQAPQVATNFPPEVATKKTRVVQDSSPPELGLLFKLPPELRNRIYEDVLAPEVDAKGVRLPQHIAGDDYEPGLLRSCKTIRAETTAMYYTLNTFRIESYDSDARLAFAANTQSLSNISPPVEYIRTPNGAHLHLYLKRYALGLITQLPDFSLPQNLSLHTGYRPNREVKLVSKMFGSVRKLVDMFGITLRDTWALGPQWWLNHQLCDSYRELVRIDPKWKDEPASWDFLNFEYEIWCDDGGRGEEEVWGMDYKGEIFKREAGLRW